MAAIWDVARADESYPPLLTSIEVDVAVIGAGITGLTTALEVAQAGKHVVVLEARRVGDGTTGGSTGNLYAPLTKGLASIRKKWDDRVMREVASSRASAVDYIEDTVRRLAIDCQFRRCSLYRLLTSPDASLNADLDEEFAALTSAGLAASHVSDVPLPFPIHRGLKLENQAQFDPLRYVQGLAREVSRLGGSIHEHSSVLDVDYDQRILKTGAVEVRAQHIVHATHTPKGINLLQAGMQTYREYGLSAKLGGQAYPEGIFWVFDPFHSIRSYHHAGKDYLMLIAEHHKTGEGQLGPGYYEKLKSYLSERFDVTGFEHLWSAQQYSSADGLPYIGRRHGSE